MSAFRLNADLFPESWNVWDSLGEALSEAGEVERAIESYERSLQINPGNGNARMQLQMIRGRRGRSSSGPGGPV